MSNQFPVSVCRPQTIGKNDTGKKNISGLQYINLENTQNRRYALEDPQGFIKQYHQRIIIDEAQYAPELFSYIQENVDENV
jgi:predicted AAA+ superfamily ATPase